MKRILWSSLMVALVLGCATAEPGLEQARTETDLFGAPGSYWSVDGLGRAQVPVCWMTPGWATEKAWVRSSAEAQWGAFSTVQFTGWGDCNEATPRPAVRIIVDNSGEDPWSMIGRAGNEPSMR